MLRDARTGLMAQDCPVIVVIAFMGRHSAHRFPRYGDRFVPYLTENQPQMLGQFELWQLRASVCAQNIASQRDFFHDQPPHFLNL